MLYWPDLVSQIFRPLYWPKFLLYFRGVESVLVVERRLPRLDWRVLSCQRTQQVQCVALYHVQLTVDKLAVLL